MQDHGVVAVRNAHHLADDGQRQPCGHMLDEVARPGLQEVVHNLRRRLLHVVLELVDHPGSEGPGHNPAQPRMPRVVHVDHGSEVLVELDRQVDQARCALPGTEHLRIPACLAHVRMPDQGVIAAAGDRERDFRVSEEWRLGQAAQGPANASRRWGSGRPQNSDADRSTPPGRTRDSGSAAGPQMRSRATALSSNRAVRISPGSSSHTGRNTLCP